MPDGLRRRPDDRPVWWAMTSASVNLEQSVRRWVESTKGASIPVPSDLDLTGSLLQLKPYGFSKQREVDRNADDETLNILSLLGSQLLAQPDPSQEALDEASVAFNLLSALESRADEFGELYELRCRFSFAAWRHARALGRPELSRAWLEIFDHAAVGASTVRDCVTYFLMSARAEESAALSENFLVDAESLLTVTSVLRDLRNEHPAVVERKLPALREWVDLNFRPPSFRDEREYFLAELELSAAVCAKWAGCCQASLEIIERAKRLFSQTREAESGTLDAEVLRLSIRYETGHYDEVLRELPGLQTRLNSSGMATSLAKSWLLEGVALKSMGRVVESLRPLRLALESEPCRRSAVLRTFALGFLADSCILAGRRGEALNFLKAAAESLGEKDTPTARTHLKAVVGEGHRIDGDVSRAIAAYREAREEWQSLGAERWAAYTRLLTAEALLLTGREKECEAEVLAALPTIERLKMVAEGLSALALLRESVRRRRTNRTALRDVARHVLGNG